MVLRTAQLATFASGKQYNADLNGALNIAARGLAMLLGILPQNKITTTGTGKSSAPVARMPLVLADIWTYAMTHGMKRPALRGPSNQPACTAVGV